MKTLVAVLLGCSLGFSATTLKLNGQAPSVNVAEINVGSVKFKNGFFAVNENADSIIGGRVQVDAASSTVNIKWFKVKSLPAQKIKLRSVLSVQKLEFPIVKMESPILSLGSDDKERHPMVSTPWWNIASRSHQITEDPFLPAQEEQYKCFKEKSACFRVNGQSSKVDFKVALKSINNGQTLVFTTDYEYSEEQDIPSETMDRCRQSYMRCELYRGKGRKIKYHPVSLDEIDMKRAFENYGNALADVVVRTTDDYQTVQKNMAALVGSVRSCFYNVRTRIETAITSQLVEGIRGEGVDHECLNNRLSAFRARFLPDVNSGLIYSQEQEELAALVTGFEKKCPYEIWGGREKNYKMLQKQCVDAGVEQLDVRTRQVYSELSRYLN